MAVIGITGSIASGKSTFSRMLADRISAEIFDADLEARDLLESDPDVRREVVSAMGSEAYNAQGQADRPFIRKRVFSDPEAKARLEGILHPRVRARWMALVAERSPSAPDLIVDIPLLFETGAESFFDEIVVVACAPEVQLERLASRGLSQEEGKKIIASQLPVSEKIARSRFVAWNDGSLEILARQVEEFRRRIIH